MRTLRAGLIPGVLALAAVALSSLPAHAQTGSWAAEASTTNAGRGQLLVSDGVYVYSYGGDWWGSGPQAPTRRFDPATNIWLQLADMPQIYTYGHCGAYVSYNGGGYIYVFGNENWDSSSIYKYNITTNQWTTLPITLPGTQRYYAQAATVRGRVYVGGGGVTAQSNFDELNPATDTLRAMTPMPGPRRLQCSAGIELTGKIYVISGEDDNYNPTSTCWEFDPNVGALGTWTPRADLIVGGTTYYADYGTAFSLKNRIFVQGGDYYPNNTWIFDPNNGANGTWTLAANTTQSHYWHGGAATSTKGYVYGGYYAPSSFEEYTPPVFGTPPLCNPATVQQIGMLGVTPVGGWTGTSVTFSATITDNDVPAQQVALEVEVRPSGGVYSGVPSVTSGLQPQGVVQAVYNFPANGGYDWRWRIVDQDGNYVPSVAGVPSWNEFNAASPDIQADLQPPSTPMAVFPISDITFSDPPGGDLTYEWTDSIDNGPVVTYELQVSYGDPTFTTLYGSATGLTTTTYDMYMAIQPGDYYWRVRALDIGGNPSNWSNLVVFKVLEDNHIDNGKGDGLFGDRLTCAASTPGRGGLLGALVLAGLALATLRRR